MARKVIVARYTADELDAQEAKWREAGAASVTYRLNQQQQELARQKEQLAVEQVKAVTDLIRATTENLSKAGYLIGKLNKDNSR